MVIVRRYILLAALFSGLYSTAQEATPETKLPVFRQVTHPFMPPVTSEYFFFSEDGLLWFSTAYGLTSFDGSELLYHSSIKQTIELGLNRIGAIVEDQHHNFYVTAFTGLLYYDRRTRKLEELPYVFKDIGKKNIMIGTLYCDKSGLIYAGSIFHGLFIYDPRQKKMSHFNLDPSKPDSWGENTRLNSILGIVADPVNDNLLWIGTTNGIYSFDKRLQNFKRNFDVINPVNYFTSSPITGADTSLAPQLYDIVKMEVADDTTIWFNCWAYGFGKFNMRTGRVKFFLQSTKLNNPARNIGQIITKFGRYENDKYLLGIYDGKSAIFNARTEQVSYFSITGFAMREEQTRFVTNDREGNLWVLQKGNIYTSVPEKFRLQHFLLPNTTSVSWLNPLLKGIYYDAETSQYLLSCFKSTGIHVLDSNFQLVKIIPTPKVNNYFNYNSTVNSKITKDGSGRYWTVGWESYILQKGADRFQPLEQTIASMSWLKTKNNFLDVRTTSRGNILYKKTNGTIYHIDHLTLALDSIVSPEIKAEGVNIKNASSWYDPKRDLVYLTRRTGIAQMNLTTKKLKVIPTKELFGGLGPDQGEVAPTLDASGRLWLMIPRYGIRIIDPEKLICLDSISFGSRGLIRADYTAMVGGSESYILLRSRNGITVYDFQKKQSFLFDNSNGLSTPDDQAFLYSNGHLIISQAERVEYFRLSDLDQSHGVVKAYLNKISSDTVDYYPTSVEENSTLNFRHFQNTLEFSFSANDFIFPERIEYGYQLIGIDNDWKYTNYFNRKIIYAKLDPGKYVFKLKAQTEGGNWSVIPTEYVINIKPAWWQTTLFKVICVILTAGLIIWLLRLRIRNIEKKEKQKTFHEKQLLELEAKALRAQMNPHFIFNSMNSIKALINKNENEKATGYLTTFSKLIRTLFQNSDKREISLYEELETCRLYTELERMRFGDNVNFSFEIDPKIDLKDVKIPALVLQPFIENAIWHGLVHKERGGEVSVRVQASNGSIECIVDDNGIGRELSKQYKKNYETTYQSKGIGLTQSRLELDKMLNDRDDSIAIIDKKDLQGRPSGTRVIITFKE